ncbi:unnamed protein product, partial [Chrysoparadoxa australica]
MRRPGCPEYSSLIHALQSSSKDEWCYIAEGGAHVLMAYIGAHPLLLGMALRLRKADRAMAEGEAKYVAQVMEPLLGKVYTGSQKHMPVRLGEDQVQMLQERCHEFRPEERRACDSSCDRECWCCWGMLEPNFCTIWLESNTISTSTAMPVVTLEVKPKRGCMPSTMLLDPAGAALKRSVPRFQAMQLHKLLQELKGGCPQPWGFMGQLTRYSPLDLFSGEREGIEAALHHLMGNPLNKLKLFVNGSLQHGSGCTWTSQEAEAIQAALPSLGAGAGGTGSDLCALWAEILWREPLLHQLLQVQQLDVLDVEGAVAVLGRMTDLLEGDEEGCLRMLQDQQGNLTAAALQDACLRFAGLLYTTNPGLEDEDEAASWRAAGDVVSRLALDDCAGLLQAWLTAQAASDCSLMLTLREGAEHREEEASHWRGQTSMRCGQLGLIEYCLGVVDIAPKHPCKIAKKGKEEEKVWESVKE